MARKGGLGKGLDALFADNSLVTEEMEQPISLRITEIEPNRAQPRKTFDEAALLQLSDSIAQHGIIQPLIVRPLPGGGYQLVAGERRWRAARMLGLTEVPVVIRELDDTQTMEIALIENLQREDLNPIEEAEGLQILIQTYGMTQEEAAKRVGRSRPAVANALRLLNLPDPVKELARNGKLSAGHARALLAFEDAQVMADTADMIVKKDISVREVERLAKLSQQPAGPETPEKPAKDESRDPYYHEVELALGEELGRRVKIQVHQDKGRLEIEFFSREDLAAIANKLGR